MRVRSLALWCVVLVGLPCVTAAVVGPGRADAAAPSRTTLVSQSTDGAVANAKSLAPSISADGRFIVFTSDATNLVSDDTNGLRDVFLRDVGAGTTTRITANGVQPNGASDNAVISGDGSTVVWQSKASNFVANGNSDVNIYLWKRATGTVTLGSVQADGTPYPSGAAACSNGAKPPCESNTYAAVNYNGTVIAYSHVFGQLTRETVRNLATGARYDWTISATGVPATLSNDGLRLFLSKDGTVFDPFGNHSSLLKCGGARCDGMSADGHHFWAYSAKRLLVYGESGSPTTWGVRPDGSNALNAGVFAGGLQPQYSLSADGSRVSFPGTFGTYFGRFSRGAYAQLGPAQFVQATVSDDGTPTERAISTTTLSGDGHSMVTTVGGLLQPSAPVYWDELYVTNLDVPQPSMGPTGTVAGRVTRNGAGVPGVAVDVFADDGLAGMAVTDASGAYSVSPVNAGAVRVLMVDPSNTLEGTWAPAARRLAGATRYTMASGATTQVDIATDLAGQLTIGPPTVVASDYAAGLFVSDSGLVAYSTQTPSVKVVGPGVSVEFPARAVAAPVISADGRYVAWVDYTYSCVPFGSCSYTFYAHVRDLSTGAAVYDSPSYTLGGGVALSGDHRFLAYGTTLLDLTTGSTSSLGTGNATYQLDQSGAVLGTGSGAGGGISVGPPKSLTYGAWKNASPGEFRWLTNDHQAVAGGVNMFGDVQQAAMSQPVSWTVTDIVSQDTGGRLGNDCNNCGSVQVSLDGTGRLATFSLPNANALGGLPPGTYYYLRDMAAGVTVPVFVNGTTPSSQPQLAGDDSAMFAASGSTVYRMPLTLPALSGSLATSVVDGSGAPVAGVSVRAVPTGGGPVVSATSDGSGSVVLGVLAGSYRVQVVDPSGRYGEAWFGGAGSVNASTVSVPAGGSVSASVSVSPAGPSGISLVSSAPAGKSFPTGASSPSVSADGLETAFVAKPADSSFAQVWVHDERTGSTVLASQTPGGGYGNGANASPEVSADGRFVAFRSAATNLAAADTDGSYDAYVFDTTTSSVSLVSTDAGGVKQNASVIEVAIGGDGSRVAFASAATNLGATTPSTHAWVKDLADGSLAEGDVSSSGASANGQFGVYQIGLTFNGQAVTFLSAATNLDPLSTSGLYEGYVHDFQDDSTNVVSLNQSFGLFPDHTDSPVPSEDYTTFAYWAAGQVWVEDSSGVRSALIDSTGRPVSSSCISGLTLSRDGRYLTMQTCTDLGAQPAPQPGSAHTYRVDRASGRLDLVATTFDGRPLAGSEPADTTAVAADGSVAFTSDNGYLVGPGSASTVPQVYVRHFGNAQRPPGVISSVTETPGNRSVQLSWARPADSGTSAVTSYVITRYDQTLGQPSATYTVPATQTSFAVTGLTNGSPYIFRVAATNATGTGPGSNTGTAVFPHGAITATPQSIQDPTRVAKAVTLSGTATDGGPLTYTVTAQPAHGTLSGTAPNLTYTPTAGDTATSDRFAFTVADSQGNTSSAANVIVEYGCNSCVTGVVTLEDGSPGTGARVLLYKTTGAYTGKSVYVDANGVWTLTGVAPASYQVLAVRTGNVDTWYGPSATRTSATTVPVTATSPAFADTALPTAQTAAGAVIGTVTDAATGQPVAGVNVRLWHNLLNTYSSVTTDANGHYTFRGQPVGSYQLQFAKAGRTTTWWLNATSQTTATTITLNSTGDVQADTTM